MVSNEGKDTFTVLLYCTTLLYYFTVRTISTISKSRVSRTHIRIRTLGIYGHMHIRKAMSLVFGLYSLLMFVFLFFAYYACLCLDVFMSVFEGEIKIKSCFLFLFV